MKLWGVAETWRDFTRPTKRLFFFMFVFGVFVFAFGISADVYEADWLKGYSYIRNILAGFTGFLVSVPVALVGFSTITGQREEKAASDRVQSLTHIAWNQFRDAVDDLCGEKRIDAIDSIANVIQQYHDQTLKGFENYENSEKTGIDRYHLQSFIGEQIRGWKEQFAQMMRSVGTAHDLRMSWYGVLRDWNTS